MSDVLVPVDAGWYPDPRGEHDRRFWDGADWTEHTRGHAHAAPPAHHASPVAVHASSFAPISGANDGPARGIAVASLVFGIVSLIANVFLIPSALGLVFGITALVRRTSRRGVAVVGIWTSSVGVVGFAFGLVLLFVALPAFLSAQHAAIGHRAEVSIQQQAASRGVTLVDVRCVMPREIVAGEVTTCSGALQDGTAVRIEMTFTDSAGGFYWRAE